MKKYFYIDAGLGNRLNLLYSSLFWCGKLNIKPIILWKVEYSCYARFEELFEAPKDFDVKYVYTLSIRKDSFYKNVFGRAFIRIIKSLPSYCSARKTKEIFDLYGEKGIAELLCSDRNKYIASHDILCSIEHFRKAIPLLQPSNEIKKRVDEIMSPHREKRLIGIHIRRTDHVLSIKHSPIELFYSKMREIIDEGDTIFYVASDDQSVLDNLSKEFPIINPIRFSDKLTRSSSSGVKDAYVDMLCLSKCDKIYGSYNSTFSVMAGIIGNVECEILAI